MLYNIVVSLTFTSYHYSAKAIKQPLLLVMLLVWLSPLLVRSQIPETPAAEQQLENLTENNADAETEDDSYSQQMLTFVKHPININTATADALKELRVLNPLQIQQLLNYRNIFGKFIDIYELQAIPSFTPELFQKIKYYITIQNEKRLLSNLNSRLKNGEHSILLRLSQTLERAKGFLIDSSAANNFYPGSPQKILVRYKYQFKNLLQYGLIAEKDAGEQFFKGAQKRGFDFYSAHLFARNLGIIKSLAIGDFTVNLGQGLIQWQSLAFKKSADVINIKREAAILRPYNAAGEINFHRGLGITLQKQKIQATFFASYKKIDGNFVKDTSQAHEDFISSLQTSGYHRTKSETADKNIQQQFTIGGNLSFNHKGWYVSINAVQYQFKLPLKKSSEPYNLYALSGNSFGNYSVDYNYTYKNLHFFGEAAASTKLYKAFVNGILISAASSVDMSILYRNISKGYQSLYTAAFTESTLPTNEKGLYAGVAVHPGSIWRIDAYADLYKFPWLKFRVDAPSTGSDYLLQLTYKPGKHLEIYSRFRSEGKPINIPTDQSALTPPIIQSKQSWRIQFTYHINTAVTIRNRAEMVWYNNGSPGQEQGFLSWVDILYKPTLIAWAANLRLQYFETDSYNSRVYAYENDVLYSFSIPVFYDKGIRYYLNANYDVNKKMTLWIKWAQTIYSDKTSTGSGLDEIYGNKKSEIKLQLQYRF